jgi:hypothetical protein
MLTYALPERRTLAELQPIPLLKQIEPPAIWTEATHPISSFLALLVQKYKYFWTEATPAHWSLAAVLCAPQYLFDST